MVLLAAGLVFLWALLLGSGSTRGMAKSPDGLAHPYIDTAHRAALLYSFATLLIATFVELSGCSEAVDLVAAFALILFFVGASPGYAFHGWKQDTDNQFRDPIRGTHAFIWAPIAAEVGGSAVLLAGFRRGPDLVDLGLTS